MFKFSNIDSLKRDRKIEAETGIDIKISDDIFLKTLAASDANPRWRKKGPAAYNELRRLENKGVPPENLQGRFAELYTDALVIGWHGGYDKDGNVLPGGPRDENKDLVPFNRDACVQFLTEADDAIETLRGIVMDTKNFRVTHAAEVIDTIKKE